jgi:hypothetical protein
LNPIAAKLPREVMDVGLRLLRVGDRPPAPGPPAEAPATEWLLSVGDTLSPKEE